MSKPEGLAKSFLVEDGRKFHLDDLDPGATGRIKSKEQAQELLEEGVRLLSEKQEQLYAQDQWAVLLILQGMDAAGKDSVIKHVMSGVNPEGCQVYGFKQPSAEELNHDFLWRTVRHLPERGKIGIFNRSYYEEVLIVRAHPELLGKEKIPRSLITNNIWEERFEDICAYERYLARNGMVIRKFFLHISKKEQKQRFLRRLEEPEKNWKFTTSDAQERERWNDYMRAYEEMIRKTATPHAPWYVVPGDHKWFARLVVASAIVDTLEGLNLTLPKVDPERRRELRSALNYLKGKAH